MSTAGAAEAPLPGRATAGVVRVGDTVRRPAGPWTDAVDALLAHLHRTGFAGAPRPLGRDDAGRQVLEFVPGEVGPPGGGYPAAQLAEIAGVLRDLHDAAASFRPPTGAVWNQVIPPDRVELICHGDPAPWNLVRSPGRGWVFIDWDAAGPGSRLWDLAYLAQAAVPLRVDRDPADGLRGLRAVADGYRLDDGGRARLPALLGVRAQAMADLLARGKATGTQPWARIDDEDGAYWRDTAAFLARSSGGWAAALGPGGRPETPAG